MFVYVTGTHFIAFFVPFVAAVTFDFLYSYVCPLSVDDIVVEFDEVGIEGVLLCAIADEGAISTIGIDDSIYSYWELCYGVDDCKEFGAIACFVLDFRRGAGHYFTLFVEDDIGKGSDIVAQVIAAIGIDCIFHIFKADLTASTIRGVCRSFQKVTSSSYFNFERKNLNSSSTCLSVTIKIYKL